MSFEDRYLRQVRLLVDALPFVAQEKCFALKGGTAINLFVRDMPRLSVDIDLTYLPVEDRDTSLRNVETALRRIGQRIHRGSQNREILYSPKKPMTRFDVRSDVTIKVEVSPVTRGCLFAPEMRAVRPIVEEQFGFAEVPVVSFVDLYAGKICAALDRQHPRDWFDVMLLLDTEGFNRRLMQALLVYLASSGRPTHELLSGRWKDIRDLYARHFIGMTRQSVDLTSLEQTRERLLDEVARHLLPTDVEFLLSLIRTNPQWELLGIEGAERLPALHWKLVNLRKLSKTKLAEIVEQLAATLEGLTARGRDLGGAGDHDSR